MCSSDLRWVTYGALSSLLPFPGQVGLDFSEGDPDSLLESVGSYVSLSRVAGRGSPFSWDAPGGPGGGTRLLAVEGGVRFSGPLSVTSPWKVTIARSWFSCGEEVPTVGASVNAHSRTEVNTVLA